MSTRIEVGDVVQAPAGAIGAVVDWVDHGMRPGTFTIEWDESTYKAGTSYCGVSPEVYWTREIAEATLTVIERAGWNQP